jgi:hypothetical protein
MRLSPLCLAVAAAVSTVAACTLNTAGLGSPDSRVAVLLPDAGGAAGASGAAGEVVGEGGRTGDGTGGFAGSNADAGSGGAAANGGAGGSNDAGATGAAGTGVAGSGAAGTGVAGSGAAGAGVGGSAGATGGHGGSSNALDGGVAGTNGTPDAHPISSAGCADGTREGFTSIATYPDLAACAGGWQIPGLIGPGTTIPACERRAGDDGARPDGQGCSVADLCAEGWHVCESAHEFSTKATDCGDALPPAGGMLVFYGTRQRGPDKTCDPANLTGTNNVYGCGNFGSPAMAACAPFKTMIRDADCKANPPWMCVDGPIDYNVSELLGVTKPGAAHGGVLCCR